MKKIKLTQGKYALVDDDMFEYLNQWKWCITSTGYAITRNKSQIIYMHRLLNNTSIEMETDHINRNKLDNRRKNLRTSTKMLNGRNREENKNNTSGYKGISWKNRDKRWQAYIKVNYKLINLGHFKNLMDAIEARKKGEEIYWL